MAETDEVEDIDVDVLHGTAEEPANVLLSSIKDSIVSHRIRNCNTSKIFPYFG
jgi:hypothetical protein